MKIDKELLKAKLKYTNLITELHSHLDLDLLNKIIEKSEQQTEDDFLKELNTNQKGGK